MGKNEIPILQLWLPLRSAYQQPDHSPCSRHCHFHKGIANAHAKQKRLKHHLFSDFVDFGYLLGEKNKIVLELHFFLQFVPDISDRELFCPGRNISAIDQFRRNFEHAVDIT